MLKLWRKLNRLKSNSVTSSSSDNKRGFRRPPDGSLILQRDRDIIGNDVLSAVLRVLDESNATVFQLIHTVSTPDTMKGPYSLL